MARKNGNAVSNIISLDAVGIFSGFAGVGILPTATARRGIAKPAGGKGKPAGKRGKVK